MKIAIKKLTSIIYALIAATSLAAMSELPSIKVPEMDKGPNLIDGLFAEKQWNDAAKIESFKSLNGKDKVKEQSKCYVLQDKDNLYIGFVCYFKDYQKTINAFQKNPDKVFAGDSVEIFIDPGRSGNYVQIGINPSGKVFFAGKKAEIRTGVQVFKDRYQIELSIPFKSIPMPQEKIKNTWGMNFCRTNRQTKEWTCWSPTIVGFHNSSRFGSVEGMQVDVPGIFKKQKEQEEGNLVLLSDRVFYDIQKCVTLKVKVGKVKSLKGYSLHSQITNTNGEVVSKKTTRPVFFSNRIKPSISSLKNGRYQLAVQLLNEHNQVVEHGKITFWKISKAIIPEEKVEVKNHTLMINGKFFFPIAIHLWNLRWNEISQYAGDRKKQLQILESRLKDLNEHGFNTVVSSVAFFRDEILENEKAIMESGSRWPTVDIKNAKNFKINFADILKLLTKYNFRIIPSSPFLKKADFSNDQLEAWSQLILKYRSKSGILCWMSGDELDGYVKRNKKVYEMLKELDPYHPVFINVINAVFPNKHNGDIISTDPYPVPNAPLTAVSVHADRLMSAVGKNPKQSFWLVLQLYGATQEKKRCPTPAEIKCMTYLALNHGVKGLDYFAYYPPKERKTNGIPQSNSAWDYMKEQNRQTQILAPVYCLGKKVGGSVVSSPEIDLAVFEYQKHLYLIAVNTAKRKINCTIKVPALENNKKGKVLFENRNVSLKASKLNDTFEGYQVHIYEF